MPLPRRKRLPRRPPARILALGLLPSMAFGCETRDHPPADSSEVASYSVRDSAGVRIVESTAPAWAPETAWTLAGAPSIRIGVIDGAPEYQLSAVVGAWRFADGTIAVADRQSRQIRYYDAGGRFLAAAGGPGEGPGEFRTVGAVYPQPGDSLAIWDSGLRRISVYDREGRLGRTMTIASPDAGPTEGTGMISLTTIPQIQGVLPDGSYVLQPTASRRIHPGEPYRVDRTFLRYSSEGTLLDTLGVFPGPEGLAPPLPGEGPFLRLPFPHPLPVTMGESGLYLGTDGSHEIRILSYDGAVERLIRAAHLDLTVNEAHREAYREEQRARFAEDEDVSSEELEAALARVAYPATLPPFTQLIEDSERHLWAREYRPFGRDGPERWSVFDPEGRLLGTVETPHRLTVHQIGRDFVLGAWTDELDVPYLQIYPLDRR